MRKGGETFPAELTVTRVEAGGEPVFCGWVRDIGERKRFERHLRYLADHDPLTDLLNRTALERDLAARLEYQSRYGGEGALVIFDVDNFKHLNDSRGHKAGDQYLASLAVLLRTRMRRTDRIARIGGDEFGILLPEASIRRARRVGDEIVEMVREHDPVLGGRRARLSASVGVITFGRDDATAEEVFDAADASMYDAKNSGRDRVVVRPLSEVDPEEPRRTWGDRIRHALDEDAFELFAQPIVDLSTGNQARQEVLLRLRTDEGLLLPASFLNAAERFDLVQAVDRWVVQKAIAHVSQCPDAVLELNLSAKSIADERVVAFIEQSLKRADVKPGTLIFEITETEALANLQQAREFAERLRRLGCRFALDDFGTGFGSFSYIKHLPVDSVKIDGEFIRDLPRAPVDQEVVRAITQLAGVLGFETIAEGVEESATADILRDYGVDFGQGFLYGHPAPLA
jgi:diguanylate cyclase (GGDEF)-like protein